MGIEARHTVAVLLGADHWDHYQELNIKEQLSAFRNSYIFFRDYIMSSSGLAIPRENISDLFNEPGSPAELKRRIVSFLQSRKTALGNVTDAIFYYVGHGDYYQRDSYYIATRGLDKNDIRNTGFDIVNVVDAYLDQVTSARHLLILDACFAAGAVRAYLGQDLNGQAEGVKAIVEEKMPRTGAALFCAAGRKAKARTPIHASYTMFTGALSEALKAKDNEDVEKPITLRELGARMQFIIRDTYKSEGVMPEIHLPIQDDGDISALPYFRLLGVGVRNNDYDSLLAKISDLGSIVSQVTSTLEDIRKEMKDISELEVRNLGISGRIEALEDWRDESTRATRPAMTPSADDQTWTTEDGGQISNIVNFYRAAELRSQLLAGTCFVMVITSLVVTELSFTHAHNDFIILSSGIASTALLALISLIVVARTAWSLFIFQNEHVDEITRDALKVLGSRSFARELPRKLAYMRADKLLVAAGIPWIKRYYKLSCVFLFVSFGLSVLPILPWSAP